MRNQEKSIQELLTELHQLDKSSGQKIRKLQADQSGNLLLDKNNMSDVEWFENDVDYQ